MEGLNVETEERPNARRVAALRACDNPDHAGLLDWHDLAWTESHKATAALMFQKDRANMLEAQLKAAQAEIRYLQAQQAIARDCVETTSQ